MPLRRLTGTPIPEPPTTTVADAAPAPPILNVPQIPQKQNQWCWAACTAMIARFLDLAEPQQCQLANFLFGQTNCCLNPSSGACNRPAQYADVLRVYNHLGISLLGPDFPLLFNTVVAEINAGRPFEVALAWSGGGGHVVIVYGLTAGGLLLVRDPWYGSMTLPYSSLYSAYGLGRWVASYGHFRRV